MAPAADAAAAADDLVSGDPLALLSLSRSASSLRLAANGGDAAFADSDLSGAAQTVAARVAAAKEAAFDGGASREAGASAGVGTGGNASAVPSFLTPRLAPRELDALEASRAAVDDITPGSPRGEGSRALLALPAAPNAALALAVLPDATADASALTAVAAAKSRALAAHAVAHASGVKLQEAACAGIAQVLNAMSEHVWVASVQEAGLTALHNLVIKVEGRSPAMAAQGIRACVAAMAAHGSTVAVQEQALLALRALCQLAEPGEVLEEGVEAVVALAEAHINLAPLQELSMRTLMALLGEESIVTRVTDKAVSVGALEAAVDAMRTHAANSAVQEHGLNVLLLLLSDSTAARRAQAIQAGCVPACVTVLRMHVAILPPLPPACRVLRLLCGSDDGAASSAAASGCAEALVDCLRAHRREEVLAEACAAALRTMLGSPAGKARAVNAGALEALCLALFAFPASRPVQAACAGAIKSLAVLAATRARPAAAAAIEGLLIALKAFGAGRAGIGAAAGDLPAVQFASDAAGALANLMIDAPLNQERVASAGGIAVLVECMQCHVSSASVCEATSAALWALATDSDTETLLAIGEAGAADALVCAMRVHVADAEFQCMAGAALRNLAHLPATAGGAASAGAVEALLVSLRLHGDSAVLQEGLFDALTTLCVAGGDMVVAAAAADGALLVTSAAMKTRFPTHPGVLRAAGALEVLLKPHAWHGRGSKLLA